MVYKKEKSFESTGTRDQAIQIFEVFPKHYKHKISRSIPKVLSKNDAFLIAHAQIRTGK